MSTYAVSMNGRRGASATLRITRRGRLVVSLVLVLLAAAALVVGSQALAARGDTGAHATVVVHEGDTLDSIAAQYYPETPRFDAVMRLDRANHLNSHHLEAGQVIVVPAE